MYGLTVDDELRILIHNNGNETDIDCGGGFCQKCLTGRGCGIAFDCRSNQCGAGKCRNNFCEAR